MNHSQPQRGSVLFERFWRACSPVIVLGVLGVVLLGRPAAGDQSTDLAPWEEVPLIIELTAIGDQFPPDIVGKYEQLLTEWTIVSYENGDGVSISFNQFLTEAACEGSVESDEYLLMCYFFWWGELAAGEWWLD